MIKPNTIFKTWEERREALARLKYETYQEFVDSAAWKQFKSDLLNDTSFSFQCKICKRTAEETKLDLHHLSYRYLDELDKQKLVVIAVCRLCHLAIHKFACLFPEKSLEESTKLFLTLFDGKQNYKNN